MDTGRRRNVDDVARLPVLDTEVGRRSADQVEWRSAMKSNDRVPLFVGHLVNYAVPRVACVVDNDVNLAIAKGSGFFNETVDVRLVGDVACDGQRLASVLVDALSDIAGLF